MTLILALPVMALKAVANLMFAATETEQRIMEQKAQAEFLMNVVR